MAETWLLAFALTLAVEVPLVAVATRRVEPRLGRRLAFAVFASLATHPVVWYVFPDLPLDAWTSLVLAEAVAVGGEAAFYVLAFPGLGWRRAAPLALGANVASFAVGWVAAEYFGLF